MLKFITISAISLLFLGSGAAKADTLGITGFTGGTAVVFVNNPGNTIGFGFTPNVAITVDSLSLFDLNGYGSSITVGHAVGLWDSVGNLLASVNISNANPLIGDYYTQTITPILLSAGLQYQIGAYFTGADDYYIYDTTSVSTSSDITFGGGYYNEGASLTDPTSTTGTYNGRFGPNFGYTAASVPEPASAAILVVGWLMAGLARRRQRIAEPA